MYIYIVYLIPMERIWHMGLKTEGGSLEIRYLAQRILINSSIVVQVPFLLRGNVHLLLHFLLQWGQCKNYNILVVVVVGPPCSRGLC